MVVASNLADAVYLTPASALKLGIISEISINELPAKDVSKNVGSDVLKYTTVAISEILLSVKSDDHSVVPPTDDHTGGCPLLILVAGGVASLSVPGLEAPV